jgi:two-component system response regulator YesN
MEEKKQQQTLLQMNKALLLEMDRQDFLHLCIGTIDPEEILNRRKRLRLLSTEDFENTYCAVVDVQIMNYVDVLCSNSIFKKEVLYEILRELNEENDEYLKAYQVTSKESEIKYFILLQTSEHQIAYKRLESFMEKLRINGYQHLCACLNINFILYPGIMYVGEEKKLEENARLYISYLAQNDFSSKDLLLEAIEMNFKEVKSAKWYIDQWVKLLIEINKLEMSDIAEKIINSRCIDDLLNIWRSIDAIVSEYLEKHNSVVIKAKKYIEYNFNSDISLTEVADAINMNPAYLSRVFRIETGERFVDYLIRIRMEKAKELLVSNCYNVGTVAKAVGYSQIQYFRKTFRNHTGMRPKEFVEYQEINQR